MMEKYRVTFGTDGHTDGIDLAGYPNELAEEVATGPVGMGYLHERSYECIPVGASLADDPEAVERFCAAFYHDWPVGAAVGSIYPMVKKALRAAETEDAPKPDPGIVGTWVGPRPETPFPTAEERAADKMMDRIMGEIEAVDTAEGAQ